VRLREDPVVSLERVREHDEGVHSSLLAVQAACTSIVLHGRRERGDAGGEVGEASGGGKSEEGRRWPKPLQSATGAGGGDEAHGGADREGSAEDICGR